MLRFDYETRWIITIILLAFLGIALLVNKLLGGVIFNYRTKVRSKDTSNFLLGFQWIFSALFALILPNNFLADIPFFQHLYDENELWIFVSMVVLLYASLIFTGYIYGLIIAKYRKFLK